MLSRPDRVPRSTYRLQFGPQLTFRQALSLVTYLSEMGISDLYSSPLFRSREDSPHGYDVIDHSTMDPSLGNEEEFVELARELQARNMGLLLDVVPNHMGIDDPENEWWQDVLENGRSSIYAKYFDIDWNPPEESLREKVLIPVLGDRFGRVLENQELQLSYLDQRFFVTYYNRRFPIGPRTWIPVLEAVVEEISDELVEDDPGRMELESIITALGHLPGQTEEDPELIHERYRERDVAQRRLSALLNQSPPIREALDRVIVRYNGTKGDPRSFDRLEALLNVQAYRLAYWRVAIDEINYRRFFDINELAAIRVEDPEVFEATHRLVFRLLQEALVTGLRIDHPDGLYDPQQYFASLQQKWQELKADRTDHDQLYVVIEKILEHGEELPADWPVCGTTGYEFLNLNNGLFVDRPGAYAVRAAWLRLTGQATTFADVLYDSKKTILNVSMSSELHVLAWELDRIAAQHRWSRDLTRTSLRRALREVIACFPVYRTYVRPDSEAVSEEDRRRILATVRAARRRNPAMSRAFYEFISSVLLLEHPEGITDEEKAQRRLFVLKFQQVTGPVTAKGLEDTSFYRYYPLASLNEVGGDPSVPGATVEQFHRRMAERRAQWPHALSASATHDTKRGEDMRARLNVLSEIPEDWEQTVRHWMAVNEPHRTEIDGSFVPDANEEYLFYQTIVGTWPVTPQDDEAHAMWVDRIVAYMQKALKEAKLHTSWLDPDQEYEDAVTGFVRRCLNDRENNPFVADLSEFVGAIAHAGFLNSLAQTVLKVCAPGVPDFYQGTELWDFSLVDPDNRRPVDFELRRQLLSEIRDSADHDPAALVDSLYGAMPDGRIKMYVICRSLMFRHQNPELFEEGDYVPLTVSGTLADHVCAFVREWQGEQILVAVPRLILAARTEQAVVAATTAGQESGDATGRPAGAGDADASGRDGHGTRFALGEWWGDTHIRLPDNAPQSWHNVFTDEPVDSASGEGEPQLAVSGLFGRLPIALLHARE